MTDEARQHREPAPADGANQLNLTSLHVRRACGGDTDSLNWIVERFSPLLLASAEYRLSPALRVHCDPEDLVSDVWVVALPKLGQLPPRDGRYTPVLLKFLTTTLFNKVSNLVQKHVRGKPKRRHMDRSARDSDSRGATADSLPDPATGIVTRLARREAEDLVLRSLEELDDDAREIIILRGIEQHPYDELSAVLGVAPKTLSARYRRALEKLRRRLPGSIYEEFTEG